MVCFAERGNRMRDALTDPPSPEEVERNRRETVVNGFKTAYQSMADYVRSKLMEPILQDEVRRIRDGVADIEQDLKDAKAASLSKWRKFDDLFSQLMEHLKQ
jgi:hypothetical protein